ncbi:MAG: exonuclease domain-containing protein [Oceanospirillaceae bacterium]
MTIIDTILITHCFKHRSDRIGSTKDAYQVHGINSTALIDKPLFKHFADPILDFLKDAKLVIFSADFDISFIENEFKLLNQRISLDHHCADIVCAMKFAQNVLKVPKISLDSACRRFHIDTSGRTKHGALIDTELLVQLYFKLINPKAIPLERTPQINSRKIPKHIPRAYKDPLNGELIQLNFCKNPGCDNFGLPGKNPSRKPDGSPKLGLGNNYKLTSVRKTGTCLLTCKLCNRSSVLINNRAYIEDRNRNLQRFNVDELSCPTQALLQIKKMAFSMVSAIAN